MGNGNKERTRQEKGQHRPNQISLDLVLSKVWDWESGVRKGWLEQSFQTGGEVSRIAGIPEDLTHSFTELHLKGQFCFQIMNTGEKNLPSTHHVLLLKIIILEHEAVSCL